MASPKEEGRQAGESKVFSYDPYSIEVNPDLRGRRVNPSKSVIKASIRKHGQLEPVMCRRAGPARGNRSTGKPLLVFGYTRWEIICELRDEEPDRNWVLKVQFLPANINEKTAYMLAAAENLARNEVTPLDSAYMVARMLNVYNMSVEQILDETGMSDSWVSRSKQIYALPHDLHEYMAQSVISADLALDLGDLPEDERKRLIQEALDNVGDKKKANKKALITRGDIEEAANKNEEDKPPKKKQPSLLKLRRAIRSYVQDAEDRGPSWIRVSCLNEYLSGAMTPQEFAKQIVRGFWTKKTSK